MFILILSAAIIAKDGVRSVPPLGWVVGTVFCAVAFYEIYADWGTKKQK
jgi:Na+/H+-dicarboxylate symporter